MITKLVYLGAKKLSLYLKDRITDEMFERFSSVLESNITQKDIDVLEESLSPETAQEDLIIEMTKENPIARTCIELALFEYACPYAEELFGFVIPNHGKGVSLKLSVLVSDADIINSCDLIIDAYYSVSRILSEIISDKNASDAHFSADFTLVSILNNKYMPSCELMNFISFSDINNNTDEMILWKDDAVRISEQCMKLSSSIVIVSGESFSGRRFFAGYTSKLCGFSMVTVDFAYFLTEENENILKTRIKNIIRDCFMLNSTLCISNISFDTNNYHEKLHIIRIIKKIYEEFSFTNLPMFITTEPDLSVAPFLEYICLSFEIPKLNSFQSLIVWDYFCKNSDEKTQQCYRNVADKIILPVGNIRKAIIKAHNENILNNPHKISELCYSMLDNSSFKGINRIHPKYTWDNLKLEEKSRKILTQICNHAKYQNSMFSDWNMKNSYPYGSCVSALFTGPPGTGKTMSAHVIANELNLALYRINISQIMDKYIGETEKHLEEVFDCAEKGNMVLFLDEADSLIGKRSEINNSHDKYANSQISYILQRIEDFDGIIIMATNFSNNIDPAFLRRIRYVVDFILPDKSIRNEIWHSLLNSQISDSQIDFEFLSGDNFDFSGAVIKNIVLNSAINAYAENSKINMAHISQCIIEEYQKVGRNSFPSPLKLYLE